MRYSYALASAASLAAVATARDVPQNVKDFLSSVQGQGQCNNVLQGDFYSEQGDSRDFSYCGDHLEDYGVMYLQGTGGALVNMDTDCDGTKYGQGYDGSCTYDDDFQPATSFGYQLSDYSDLNEVNTFVHNYVVLGNVGNNEDGSAQNPDYTVFKPESVGIEPMSVVAVVCGENQDKLVWGVWADENGEDGDPLVGEASISLGQMCFGSGMTGNAGWDQNNVLYIAFKGPDAVPKDKAKWDASTREEFEDSLATFGESLLNKIGGGSGGTSPSPTSSAPAGPTSTSSAPAGPTSSAPAQDCAWPGHCQGTSCSSDDDCSDPWSCVSGTCN